MSIFNKKDHVKLEELVPTIVISAFEYPFEQNIQRVQNDGNVLTTQELAKAKEQVAPFIIAVNLALLKFSAEQGKIARFKGDDPNTVEESLGYAFAIEIGNYLVHQGANKDDAADQSEQLSLEAYSYIQNAAMRLGDNPLISDVFFEICNKFRLRVVGENKVDKTDSSFIVFDFAKQLYRNINDSSKKIIVS